ncbi:MAG: hypothetical protein ACFFA6_00985 [Promethearchaeota archaeon]
MSIDKWLSDQEEEIRREKLFKSLPEEKVQELKKIKIKDITKKKDPTSDEISTKKDLLGDIIEFKNWLNQRTYLKGDIDKLEIWIKNLYMKIKRENEQESKLILKSERKQLIEQYKKIPPTFLDEKTRVALNKKLYDTKKTSTDYYFLRKLKETVNEKLKEAEYYDILRRIFEI